MGGRVYRKIKNHSHISGGDFFQKFFTNMLQRGLTPPFDCQNVTYGGDTGGGRGYISRMGPMPIPTEGRSLLIT